MVEGRDGEDARDIEDRRRAHGREAPPGQDRAHAGQVHSNERGDADPVRVPSVLAWSVCAAR